MSKIKEAIAKQAKEQSLKLKREKMWKCPKCGEEVPDNFFSKWEHIIMRH
jgi:ribosomal protein L37AE/L43A